MELGDLCRQVIQDRIDQARIDYNTFSETVLRDENGVSLQQAVLHRCWTLHLEWCWQHAKIPAILAPFGHGKCQPAGSPVRLTDGTERPIESLQGGADVLAFCWADASWAPSRGRSFPNGKRPVRRLHLWSGRTIDLTGQHPLLTVDDWMEAAWLRPGDFIATVRHLPAPLRPIGLRPGEGRLLGYLTGDGGTTQRVVFTASEPGILGRLRAVATLMGFGLSEPPPSNPIDYRITGARKWARQVGLLGKDSYAKRVPQAVFRAPDGDVADFLAAYFETDGHASPLRGGVAEYYSVSRALLADTQTLLGRFGIVSRIRRKRGRYKGQPHLSWRLVITGADTLRRFRERIPVQGVKRDVLDGLQLSGRSNPNEDGVPLAYRRYLLRTPHWHKAHTGVSLDQQSKRTTSREVVRKAALAEGNPFLLKLTSDELYWDRIVAVEELGEVETWGLEVDGLHTYVSGGVISHNTSQLVIGRISHELGLNVNLRAKVICQNDTKAMERTMGISSVLRSDKYREVFPGVREVSKEAARAKTSQSKWTQHEIYLERPGFSIDPSVQAAGVLTAGTGGRADLIIYDDVVDHRNAIDEPALRLKVANNIDGVWAQRLEPTGRSAFIGTPWHQADFTHTILKRDAWCVLRQWIAEDFSCIEQEVYGADDTYPLPAARAREVVLARAPQVSSPISQVSYDRVGQILEVGFRDGSVWQYFDLPADIFLSFSAAPDRGQFFSQVIRSRYVSRRLRGPTQEPLGPAMVLV